MGLYLAEPAMPRFKAPTDDDMQTVSASEWAYEYSKVVDSLTGRDLHDELYDHADKLAELVKAGDSAEIGEFIIAAVAMYAIRVTNQVTA
jgi:hypothetical protein